MSGRLDRWVTRAGRAKTLLCLLCLGLPASAVAEGGLLLVDAPPAQASTSVGATLLAMPAYSGSSSTRPLIIPAYEWRHPSGAFASTDLGLGWNLSRRPDLQFGVRLWPIFVRHMNEGPRLATQPGVPGGIERTAFLNWTPVPYAQLQSSLRTGFGADQRGVLAEAGFSVGAPIGAQVLVGITLGATFANAAYRRTYFAVRNPTTPVSFAGALPAVTGGGWQDLQAALGGEWQLAQQWRIDGRLERWRLLGAAAASPLAETRWQSAGVLSLWYDLKP